MKRRSRLLAELSVLALLLGLALNDAQIAAMQKFAVFSTDVSVTKDFQQRVVEIMGVRFRVPLNIEQRLYDWEIYGRGIADSPKEALMGHAEPMDRAITTSAHNYYLDVAYNFGLVALLPIFALIAYTGTLLWRHRKRIDLSLLGLALVVAFLVIADNNMKVSLRQPYPGIFTFFLWGWLIVRMSHSQPD